MNLKVNETIRKFEMIKDNDNIVLGVSGGADSISLLHFLINNIEYNNVNVIAIHINHCIRGDEADRDEEFVKTICRDWGVKLYVKKYNVKNLAKEYGISEEECGRNVRYNCFREISKRYNARIATAHTLSDNEETFIFNFTRGCGLKGLCGIPPIRDNIIRPLINVSREEIEKYCKDNDLMYVTDSTNLSTEYTRNKIRLEIIPRLKNINSNFDNVMLKMINQVSQDNEYLEKIAEEELKYASTSSGCDIKYLTKLPRVIRSRVLIKFANQCCKQSIESKHVDLLLEIINNNSGAVTLPNGIILFIENGILKVKEYKNNSKDWKHKFEETTILTDTGIKFIIEIFSVYEYNSIFKDSNSKNFTVMDLDKIPEGSLFRYRNPEDIFKQMGRGVTKKVKKLFNELKIPREKRDSLVMLASGSNVLWIDGIGISEICKVRENTKRVVVVRRVDY